MIAMRSRVKRAAALSVDAVVSLLSPLITRRSARAVLPESPRVLVIRCDHIGDAAMATCVLRPLRTALRPSTLDVLAGPWAAEIFEQHPAVDGVIRYATPWWSAARGASWREQLERLAELPGVIRQLRARQYDVAIDLRGDLRQIVFFLAFGGMPMRVSSDRTGGRRLLTRVWRHDPTKHEVEKDFAIASLLGATGTPRLDLAASNERPSLSDISERGYAVFALRGTAPNRAWPATHAASAVDLLRDELGFASVFIGNAADAHVARTVSQMAHAPIIDLCGKTSLTDSLALLRNAAVTIAVDSGPMHLAAGAGSPVVALFGPGNPRDSRPWSDNACVVSTGAPCGCRHGRCEFTDGPGRCMVSLDPAAVVDAVRELVARKPATV
jgi:ADP-heptose:LPS heptosyltransferase